jgi:hypothetical protein
MNHEQDLQDQQFLLSEDNRTLVGALMRGGMPYRDAMDRAIRERPMPPPPPNRPASDDTIEAFLNSEDQWRLENELPALTEERRALIRTSARAALLTREQMREARRLMRTGASPEVAIEVAGRIVTHSEDRRQAVNFWGDPIANNQVTITTMATQGPPDWQALGGQGLLACPTPRPQTTPQTTRQLQTALRKARAEANKLPEWLTGSGIPVRSSPLGGWELLFNIPVTIREVVYGHRKYVVPPHKIKTVHVLLGMPIAHDGSYKACSLHIISPDVSLPHVTIHGACLGLGDGPPKVTSIGEYHMLTKTLTRAMEQINLGSLYSARDEWPKEVFRALPLGTRSGRNHERKRFHVAVKKYFNNREERAWTTRDSNQSD